MSASRPMTLMVGLALASVLATGCEAPPVWPTSDKRQKQENSRIEGEALVLDSLARGNVIILLYDARYPPAPLGVGRPVSFTVIPREQMFGSAAAGAGGPFSAPFVFSQVPAGRYLLRGFIDLDTCHTGSSPCRSADFIPWYTVTGEPNSGDVGGAAVDSITRQPRVVEVARDDQGRLRPATGVTVSFSRTNTLPDRPAFYVENADARFDRTEGIQLSLRPLAVSRPPLLSIGASILLLAYQDPTGGTQPSVWPRVLVRKLAEGDTLTDAQRFADENDLNRDGILDDENPEDPSQQKFKAVTLRAELDPAQADAVRNTPGGLLPVASLNVRVYAEARDSRNPALPVSMTELPAGRYALSLVHFTGQTWRLPNDLEQFLTPAELPTVKGQTYVLEVP